MRTNALRLKLNIIFHHFIFYPIADVEYYKIVKILGFIEFTYFTLVI